MAARKQPRLLSKQDFSTYARSRRWWALMMESLSHCVGLCWLEGVRLETPSRPRQFTAIARRHRSRKSVKRDVI
jgi:hypothetical protein